ncbi:hypothetical protein SAMN04488168_1689, partial [Bacillus sp. 491mf]
MNNCEKVKFLLMVIGSVILSILNLKKKRGIVSLNS